VLFAEIGHCKCGARAVSGSWMTCAMVDGGLFG